MIKTSRMLFNRFYLLKYPLFILIVLIFGTYLIPKQHSRAGTTPSESSGDDQAWKWTLELDGKYTCVATKANARHTDIHKGSVIFDMPEESGRVEAKNGKYHYSVSGQTFGRPYRFSTPGRLTFTGEVIPGILRFTPQVYLPDGKPFFQPVKTFEISIFDGATVTVPPESNSEMTCKGPVVYTLRGGPREHYHILVDDRLLLVKDHGVWSGHTYRTGITVQVLTEMEVIIEGNKVKKTSGFRRLGRLTPTSYPPLVWNISTFRGKCRDGIFYPYAPRLKNNQVSAAILSKSSLKLSAVGGHARGAVKWTINPKQAKLVSPDIQYGRPERFNGELCTEEFLHDTVWTFPRRRNTIKTTQDSFDHLQILTVTFKTSAMGQGPAVSSGQPPQAQYFKGDLLP